MPNKNIQSIIFSAENDKSLEWVSINSAKKREVNFLRKKYNFDLSDLHDSFASVSALHPKIKSSENYIFMVLQFPTYNEETGLIKETEVDFFVSQDFLVTIHYNNISPLTNLFNTSKKEAGSNFIYSVNSGVNLFYEIMDALLDNSYKLLDQNSAQRKATEEKIFNGHSKEAANAILNLRRNITNFSKIMQSHKNKIRKFAKLTNGNDGDNERYVELIEKTKDIWEILENQKEMIEILYQTNESLLNYRLNDIMKTLTIFSVIVFPLTLLAAIFGMNTMNSMPLVNHPSDFWIILIIMLLGCVAMLGFFKWKKWI